LESNKKLKKVLEWLWDAAVSPVLNELGYNDTPSKDGDWPRIWWVRAGVFSVLPIHAAGYHEVEPRTSTIDRVISSYTPTIKALAHARNSLKSVCTAGQKILVVGMSKTPDQDDLPAEQEIDELKRILPGNISTTFKSNPNQNEILNILRQTEIFHFTGHGLSSANDPSQSCLLLKDWKTEPLSVANLRSLKIQNGHFAYLSACHSGTSINAGLRLLDESLHISTAFQLAGFRSVVATLWYVYADHSIAVAKQLYSSMKDHSKQIQPSQSAMALHHTVRRLRDELRKVPGIRTEGPDNPLIWAAYIHTGW
jgi:CHAT domain-containing protein